MNVLCIKQMSLPTMNVKNALEQLSLNYANCTTSFRHKKRVNDTESSKYLGKLKEENVDYNPTVMHLSVYMTV